MLSVYRYNVVIISLITVPQAYFMDVSSASTQFAVRFALTWVGIIVTWALMIGSHLYTVLIADTTGKSMGVGLSNKGSANRRQSIKVVHSTDVQSMSDAPTAKVCFVLARPKATT